MCPRTDRLAGCVKAVRPVLGDSSDIVSQHATQGNVAEQLTLRAVPELVPRCVHEATLLGSTGGEEGRAAQSSPRSNCLRTPSNQSNASHREDQDGKETESLASSHQQREEDTTDKRQEVRAASTAQWTQHEEETPIVEAAQRRNRQLPEATQRVFLSTRQFVDCI